MLLPPAMIGSRCSYSGHALAIAEQAVTEERARLRSGSRLEDPAGTRAAGTKRRAVVEQTDHGPTERDMFKYAVFFLVLSLIAGALGLTNVSRVAKRISLVLFALLFLVFLALIAFAYLLSEATAVSVPMPAAAALLA
jgi:uncharacterized membrane protein YtjA (UPF0391 family)